MNTILEFLCNDHSKGITRCVSFHNKLLGPVGSAKDWIVTADFFEAKKGGITFGGPNELLILASEVIKGACNVREVLDERSIEVAETQETSHIFDGLRSGPFRDSLDLDRVYLDRTIANEYTKVLNFLLVELAFLRLEEEIKFLKLVQDVVDAKLMKDFIIFGGDDHIIHVDVEPSLHNFLLKYVIHHSLKSGWGVGQAKEHNCQFEESFAGLKGGFVFIAFFNANIIVSPVDVKLGKEVFLCKIVNEFRDEWQWIFIRDCPLVQVPIVLYRMELAILLSNQEEATGIWRFRMMDVLETQVLGEEFMLFLFLFGR